MVELGQMSRERVHSWLTGKWCKPGGEEIENTKVCLGKSEQTSLDRAKISFWGVSEEEVRLDSGGGVHSRGFKNKAMEFALEAQ